MKLFDIAYRLAMKIVNPLAQSVSNHNPEKTITPGMPETLRHAAAQGAVLLENRVLPFADGTHVAVFGRVQQDWFCAGYGSGGDVNFPYSVGLLEGLRSCPHIQVNEEVAAVYESWIRENPADHGVWGNWPRFHPEMPVTEDLVRTAKAGSSHAVIVIGRASGEDRENTLEKGSYYLTDEEEQMLRQVTAVYPDAVLVLNIGTLMDLSFVKKYSLGAVLILWQGGMESGNAAADLLSGRENPSGRLTDTIALRYEDYPSADHFGNRHSNVYYEDIYVGYRYFETFAPDKVLYPFGHGLSYTNFRLDARQTGDLTFAVAITNTGHYPGKNAVLLYAEKPCGVLGNPARELVAFAKTRCLAPGETQEISLSLSQYLLASYDDAGLTGNKSCYVLQEGSYRFYMGGDVHSAQPIGAYEVPHLQVVSQCREAAAPQKAFPILAREMGQTVKRNAAVRTTDLRQRILDAIPQPIFQTGDRGLKLKDVASGKVTLDAFVAQLDLDELEAISRGAYYMGNPLGPRGNAGVFGGVTESLRQKGIPPITTTDGPSGIRLYDSCSLLPIGTLLACSFDTGMVRRLYAQLSQEMAVRGSDVLLAPGMNIHRNPLCGRNFEYFSEDPFVAGMMAASVVQGVQSTGRGACPKHFACNNQEVNRQKNDSILSERALREIYLKGFELCVRLASPKTIMTSYNKINGVWGHYHYDLVKTILRDEWGFQGMVMTDWWMQYAPSPEFPTVKSNAYRVRSRVDVLMPGSRSFTDKKRTPDRTLLATYKKPDGITLGEMQEAARQVLRCVMALKEL